jgi:protein ImuA
MIKPAQAIAAGRVSAARLNKARDVRHLAALRRRIAAIERQHPSLEAPLQQAPWNFGLTSIDERLPSQGLAINALHEIAAADYADTPPAMGFAVCLAIRRLLLDRASRPLLWCRLSHGNAEWGRLYGHGLLGLGIGRQQILTVSLRRLPALLWSVEEALRSGAFAAIIAELGVPLGLTFTRRLSLAAAAGTTPVLLVFSHPVSDGTAALSRWLVKARASTPPPFDPHAPGAPAWNLALQRCRGGRPGEWSLEWSHATHRFYLVASVPGGTVEPHVEERRPFAFERAGTSLRAG